VVWRQLGDLVSATTALGLHRQTETGPVTFLSEMKKRMITIITCLCLGSSLLTGRPPALNYRFTRFSLPLAITDDALIAGPEREWLGSPRESPGRHDDARAGVHGPEPERDLGTVSG